MNRLNPDLDNLFTQLESEYNLPSNLLKSVAYTESRFDPVAVSPAGARGMFQFMPETAKQYNVNVDDPVSSAKGAARMYSDLLKSTNGDLNQALAGYNWGIGNVQRKGMDRMPNETKNYISQINDLMGSNNPPVQKQNTNNNQSQQVNEDEEYMRFLQAREQLAQSNNPPAQEQSVNNPPAQEQSVNNNQSQQVNEDEEYMRFLQAREQLTQASNPPAQEQQEQAQQEQAQQVNNEQPIDNSNVNQSIDQSVDNSLYQNLLKLSEEEIGDYMIALKPRERLTLEKIIQDEVRKNPDLYQDSGLQNFFQGIKNTGQNWNTSLKQMGAGISDFFTGGNKTEEVNKLVRRQEGERILHDMIDPSISRTSGEIAADVGLSLAIPTGAVAGGLRAVGSIAKPLARVTNPVARGLEATGNVGRYAGQGAIGAGLSQPVEVKENESFAEEKAKQLATGAALGAGAGLVLEKGLKYIGKPLLNKLSREDEEFIKLANERGYTPLASELPSASSSLQKTGQNMARDSNDVKNISLRNQEQAVKDIEDLKNSLPSLNVNEYISKKGFSNISDDNEYYSKTQRIIEDLKSTDNKDINSVFSNLVKANVLEKQLKSNELYKISESLIPSGYNVNLNNTRNTLNNISKKIDETDARDVKKSLVRIKNNLDDIFKDNTEMDFVKLENSTKQINQLYNSLPAEDRILKRDLENILSSITKDKESFISKLDTENNSDLFSFKKAYDEAKAYNRENIQKIRSDKTLSKVLSDDISTDKVLTDLFKKGEKEKVKKIYNYLDNETKNEIQKGVLNMLIDKSTTPSGGFNPVNFTKAIRSYADPASGNNPIDIVFDKKTGQNLKELFKIFDNLGTISYARSNPQTGIQNLASLDNISKVIGVGSSITAGSFIPLLIPAITSLRKVGIEKALTNPKLHKYVLDLKNTNPKSQKYVEKASALFSFMLSQEFANIE